MIRTYQRKKLTHDRALIFDRFFVLFVIFVHLSKKLLVLRSNPLALNLNGPASESEAG
jgi:hypothetical protein